MGISLTIHNRLFFEEVSSLLISKINSKVFDDIPFLHSQVRQANWYKHFFYCSSLSRSGRWWVQSSVKARAKGTIPEAWNNTTWEIHRKWDESHEENMLQGETKIPFKIHWILSKWLENSTPKRWKKKLKNKNSLLKGFVTFRQK